MQERIKFVSCCKKGFVDINRLPKTKKCKERLNYSVEQWKMIIFSDELNFEIINRKNKGFVCHKNTKKYLKQHIKSRIQKGGGSKKD